MIFKNYFSDSWNIFDFVTVIGSIIDAIYSEFSVKKTIKNFYLIL
jgi:hypothetical protein